MLTQQRLMHVLVYSFITGLFKWRIPRKKVTAGNIAGCVTKHGYIRICVDGEDYLAHRLAWFYVYGSWPVDEIDHINGARDDNRWINLREATRTQNNQNFRKARSTSKSGLLGVHWDKQADKWKSTIKISGEKKNLGHFNSAEEAHKAYLAAKREHHPFCTI